MVTQRKHLSDSEVQNWGIVNLRTHLPHITHLELLHPDGIPLAACIKHSWGAWYTRACTRMHTYPRALVTGWRSTASSSNREPNVSLCFDWSPPDHGPCCPFCILVKRFPMVFCVVSPLRSSSFYCHLQESDYDTQTSICQVSTSIDHADRVDRRRFFS